MIILDSRLQFSGPPVYIKYILRSLQNVQNIGYSFFTVIKVLTLWDLSSFMFPFVK